MGVVLGMEGAIDYHGQHGWGCTIDLMPVPQGHTCILWAMWRHCLAKLHVFRMEETKGENQNTVTRRLRTDRIQYLKCEMGALFQWAPNTHYYSQTMQCKRVICLGPREIDVTKTACIGAKAYQLALYAL